MSEYTPAHAKKHLGQNFLTDRNILRRIAGTVAPQPEETIVEIGPGLGALSAELLQRGVAPLYMIERDAALLSALEQTLYGLGAYKLYHQDVLSFDFAALGQQPGNLVITGNLPYNISTPLLFYLLDYLSFLNRIVVLLQQEVVSRIVAPPGTRTYGRLSVMLQYYCHTEALFTVPPGAFYPAPKVTSRLLRLQPRTSHACQAADEAHFSRLVGQAFQQRRKTLRNTLKNFASAAIIEQAGIDPGARAETLAVKDFVTLSNHLVHKHDIQQ